MIKRIFIIMFCSMFTLLTFTGCNMSTGLGTFTFDKAHISVGDTSTCVKIQSWYDTELGCELKLENGTVIYCSEGTYILVNGDCPLCAAKRH